MKLSSKKEKVCNQPICNVLNWLASWIAWVWFFFNSSDQINTSKQLSLHFNKLRHVKRACFVHGEMYLLTKYDAWLSLSPNESFGVCERVQLALCLLTVCTWRIGITRWKVKNEIFL